MRYSIRTVTPLGDVPVVLSLEDAKAHLKVDFDEDDALIAGYVAGAQDAVERFTSQVLTPRTLEMSCFGFPLGCASWGSSAFDIPREPITSIVSIGYTDSTGADIDLDEAAWRWSESSPGLVRPAWSTSWPSAAGEDGSVRIGFEAGYEDGLCPASLVEAVKRQTAFLYANRGDVGADEGLAPGVVGLCRPFRRVSL